MKEKKIIEIRKLKNKNKGNIDTIFILWASPEDRCLGSLNIMSNEYSAHKIYLITYEHESQKREENIEKIVKILNNRIELKQVFVNETVPIPVLRNICVEISEIVKNEKEPTITIDITTSIKWHLLIFLKFLKSSKLMEYVRFIYTTPKDYSRKSSQPLSFGLKKIFPIPTFSGNYDFSKENLLIIILGFEGNRALSIYENLDPAETILLISDPPYYENWKGRAEHMNQKIINLVGEKQIKKVDPINPFNFSTQLNNILNQEKYDSYNHFISPLGTKLQILGLFLYLETNIFNTNLMYSVPLRHNELYYSCGIGKTFEINF